MERPGEVAHRLTFTASGPVAEAWRIDEGAHEEDNRAMHVDESPAVRSLVAALQKLCTKLPGAEQYVMVHHPAFRVGKKPFAIVGMDERKAGATLSINLGKDEQPLLLDDPRFWRTPYIGQHGWVTVPDGKLSAAERQTLVADSWRRIAGKRRIAEWEAQSR